MADAMFGNQIDSLLHCIADARIEKCQIINGMADSMFMFGSLECATSAR